ncbi:glycosyltransferase family 2 protein [Secundilactobacillus paracollinoides]|uniref:glycosyltransferase family 2 protein n=1 Tax=Secundilactobacillus paracollinoides TaxID=240427 RepID=UPI0006EEBC39|nr:glycosyltransferase family 2 protein [Secundilactobacillus paracollinoides]KRL81568.1 glycosyltransferase [Secundilactobacillus paracollinoides DSM 15502 = JCM 11969]
MEKLTIVVPAYNEEELLHESLQTLLKIEDQLIQNQLFDFKSNIVVVDDGSTDLTWDIITEENRVNSRITGIKFSRNFGHQNALMTGMQEAVKTAAAVVPIDADLQDDPAVIPEMVDQFVAGKDIVYGVRNNRETDTWFKRNSALLFYRTLAFLGVRMVQNHADFRLMSKRAVKTLLQYPERNLFIRGVIPMLGFSSTKVYYKRRPRTAGKSKYPLKKMISFAWEGLTSLSIAPVRAILVLGVITVLLGVAALVYSLLSKFLGLAVHGWSSLMISIWILGGLQMASLGIIGEYVGKVMNEVKQRPRFTIETIVGGNS